MTGHLFVPSWAPRDSQRDVLAFHLLLFFTEKDVDHLEIILKIVKSTLHDLRVGKNHLGLALSLEILL